MSVTAPIVLGNEIILPTTLVVIDPVSHVSTPTDDGSLTLSILAPDGSESTFAVGSAGIIHDDTGAYHLVYVPPLQGHYVWRYASDATTVEASEGAFDVNSEFLARVTDARDIRVMGPMVQRSLEGVVKAGWTLTPDEIKDVTADACAQILLYTGTVFGCQLNVTERDPVTMAPSEYRTDRALEIPEMTVIAAQGALNYFFHQWKGIKVSETIGDEASTWSYSLSPNLLIAQLTQLQDTRDKALEAISANAHNLESYVAFLAVRDTQVSRYIEPWVWGHPEGYGIGAGGLESDSRFDSLPYGGGDYFMP